MSKEFKDYLNDHGVDHEVSGSHAHFKNVKAEHLNRYLGELLKVLQQVESGSWFQCLSFISMSYSGNWVLQIK